MISEELFYQIGLTLHLEPTQEQREAMITFCQFLTDRTPNSVMILSGCAGTGKTTLAGAMVRTLMRLKQKVILLAPTGRAAKVFSLKSGHAAFTIHRKIYRQKSFGANMGVFNLNENISQDVLFMVDESSMIANCGLSESAFGSGRLLDDLVKYVYNGRNCRLLLVGDKAQLPPVGEEESPALSAEQMALYGLKVYQSNLNEVLRQSTDSGILYNATIIRRLITRDQLTQLPCIRFKGFADIHVVMGDELIEQLNSSYSQVGIDETIVVTRSNKRANIYNRGIRNMILDREDDLCSGDQLMVVKNNYYWTGKENDDIPFIANGDRATVLRIRNRRTLYGFHFADVRLQFPDYDNFELQAAVLLDSLTTEAPALTREQNEQLFYGVMEDYAYLPRKADRIKMIKEDIHYNAIQIKYAYAVTCHKAQGGQWAHVYIDQGYMTDDMLTPDYIHWLYTAFTRASEQLFLVNWRKEQTENYKEE